MDSLDPSNTTFCRVSPLRAAPDQLFVFPNDLWHKHFEGDLAKAPLYMLDAMVSCRLDETLTLLEHPAGYRYNHTRDSVVIDQVGEELIPFASQNGDVDLGVHTMMHHVVAWDGALPLAFHGSNVPHGAHVGSSAEFPRESAKLFNERSAQRGPTAVLFECGKAVGMAYTSQTCVDSPAVHLGVLPDKPMPLMMGMGFSSKDILGTVEAIKDRQVTRYRKLYPHHVVPGANVTGTDANWVWADGTCVGYPCKVTFSDIDDLFLVRPLALMGPADTDGIGHRFLVGVVFDKRSLYGLPDDARRLTLKAVATADVETLLRDAKFSWRLGMEGSMTRLAFYNGLARVLTDFREHLAQRDPLKNTAVHVGNTCRDMGGLPPLVALAILSDVEYWESVGVSSAHLTTTYTGNEFTIAFDRWAALEPALKQNFGLRRPSVTRPTTSIKMGPPTFKIRLFPREAWAVTMAWTMARSLGGGVLHWSTKGTVQSTKELGASLRNQPKLASVDSRCGTCLLGPACVCGAGSLLHPPTDADDDAAMGMVSGEDSDPDQA